MRRGAAAGGRLPCLRSCRRAAVLPARAAPSRAEPGPAACARSFRSGSGSSGEAGRASRPLRPGQRSADAHRQSLCDGSAVSTERPAVLEPRRPGCRSVRWGPGDEPRAPGPVPRTRPVDRRSPRPGRAWSHPGHRDAAAPGDAGRRCCRSAHHLAGERIASDDRSGIRDGCAGTGSHPDDSADGEQSGDAGDASSAECSASNRRIPHGSARRSDAHAVPDGGHDARTACAADRRRTPTRGAASTAPGRSCTRAPSSLEARRPGDGSPAGGTAHRASDGPPDLDRTPCTHDRCDRSSDPFSERGNPRCGCPPAVAGATRDQRCLRSSTPTRRSSASGRPHRRLPAQHHPAAWATPGPRASDEPP